MADNHEIDDIINEVRAKKERLDNGENPFAQDEKKSEEVNDEITINLSEEPAAGAAEVEPEAAVEPSEEAEEAQEETVALQNEPADEDDGFALVDDGEEVDEALEEELDEDEEKAKKKKTMMIVAVCIILVIVIAGVLFAVLHKKPAPEPETTTVPTTVEETTEAPVIVMNPLTGEKDFNEAAMGKRPVAIVVENAPAARPQWGISDDTSAPDIILEGEVEGGITRMLWFYADYTALPYEVGPIRSARPPFVRFSERFDAIFLHWGMSNTTGDYVGADSVFIDDDVDHINEMTYSNSTGLFGRDYNGKSGEHTGVIYGDKVAAAIEDAEFRTEAKDLTKFNFYDDVQTISDTACNSVALTYSSRSGSTEWTYSESDGMYHSNNYGTDVARENLLILFDNTQYIAKSNYKGSGSSEIYCNYEFAGGSGKYISNGNVLEITWTDDNGVITLKDENGKALSLNPGKMWIGWASANNGGSATVA